MIEKFKDKISASSIAVRCRRSTRCTIALLITSSDNSRNLSEKISLGVLRPAALLNINSNMLCLLVSFLDILENPGATTSPS